MKSEAEFTTAVKPWLLHTLGTGAYEIKHTRGIDRFNMREWTVHQRDFLAAVRSSTGMCFKIPDDGVAYKPFDMFCLKQEPAWVVTAFPEEFVVIDSLELEKWTAPSLTLRDALSLSSIIKKLSDL